MNAFEIAHLVRLVCSGLKIKVVIYVLDELDRLLSLDIKWYLLSFRIRKYLCAGAEARSYRTFAGDKNLLPKNAYLFERMHERIRRGGGTGPWPLPKQLRLGFGPSQNV